MENLLLMYVLMIIALIYTVLMTTRTRFIRQTKRKFIRWAAICFIVELLCYIAREFIAIYKWTTLSWIVNILVYSLVSIGTYFLFLSSRRVVTRNLLLFSLPAVANALLAASSPWTGFMFTVSEDAVYTRGPLFIITAICSYVYMIFWIYGSFREYQDMNMKERAFLSVVFIVLVGSTLSQNLIQGLHSQYPGAALAVTFYYMFCVEMSYKYDTLTFLRNRNAYVEAVSDFMSFDEYSVIIFDASGMKNALTHLDHQTEDMIIYSCASAVTSVFEKTSKIYRLDSSEFCVLEKSTNREVIEEKCEQVNDILSGKNLLPGKSIFLAYGFAEHKANSNLSYNEVYSHAGDSLSQYKKRYYANSENERRA